MDKRELEALSQIVQASQEQFLQSQARSFIECAINLAATCMGMKELAEYLRSQAELIEQYG